MRSVPDSRTRCGGLPIGIVWATISRRSASIQTIVKTKVVYDWLPRVAHMRDGR
jgi:hypothetical protein